MGFNSGFKGLRDFPDFCWGKISVGVPFLTAGTYKSLKFHAVKMQYFREVFIYS